MLYSMNQADPMDSQSKQGPYIKGYDATVAHIVYK
jgi:hypothetical protein